MKMNKYPYIGESRNNGTIVLFSSESYGVQLWRGSANYQDGWNESLFKNITAEYLTNTRGKVESKEHAEFIVKLAEVNGFGVFGYADDDRYFHFKGSELYFWFDDFAAKNNEKLITIPLPPKVSNMSKVQINVNNNTDSVVQITKSDDESNIFIHVNDLPKDSGEWPQVGDEVLIDLANHNAIYGHNIDGKTAVVRSIFKNGDATVYAVSNNGDCYCFVGGILKKPPTPEEKLADILTEITGYQNRQAVLSGAKAIINGEIEGLEYKPQ